MIYQFVAVFGRVYGGAVKPFKHALLVLVSSPLLWMGIVGALASFSTFILIWSGHLDAVARLADEFYISTYVAPFLAFVFMAGIGLGICGFLLGIVRLCRKLNARTAVESSKPEK